MNYLWPDKDQDVKLSEFESADKPNSKFEAYFDSDSNSASKSEAASASESESVSVSVSRGLRLGAVSQLSQ